MVCGLFEWRKFIGDELQIRVNEHKTNIIVKIKLLFAAFLAACAMSAMAQNNVAEEVAWVVGDEPIYKSDIEEQYMQAQYERTTIDGNPYCVIPERMAVEKLFLHQAQIDSISVDDNMVVQQADARINMIIANLGSKEKMEEYFRKPYPEIRQQMIDIFRDQSTIQQVQSNLTKGIKVTPKDVRNFYESLPADSLPYITKQVEVQIFTVTPVVPQSEIDDVKARLRDYSQRVTNGESEFSTLAILYSEDPGSSIKGGEIGFSGRAQLATEYANAAFNLNDSKRVSKIVETEFGYHIIQLIEKRGDRVNTRHILLRPKVPQKSIDDAITVLDSVRRDITTGKFTFEQMATLSSDKDTRNNKGIMVNSNYESPDYHTTRFEMADLNPEIATRVDKMEVGEISEPFLMIEPRTNKQNAVIVKLTNRIDGHKADFADDFQRLKSMYENKKREELIAEWIKKKQKETYVHIEDGWRDCEFQYEWIK